MLLERLQEGQHSGMGDHHVDAMRACKMIAVVFFVVIVVIVACGSRGFSLEIIVMNKTPQHSILVSIIIVFVVFSFYLMSESFGT